MSTTTTTNLIGGSAAFRETVDLIGHIAQTDAPVLIEGETGTGKEVAARAIHYSGARREHPFVAVNCGALPEHLIENELFGHARGAYTDARASQPGLVALADGGTLFLDEVESLGARGQVALLRFLQDHRYRPLGGQREEQANVRVVAATNINLPDLVAARQFRPDLFYRLQILLLRMPPLRERDGDPAILADHFAHALSARYGWRRRRLAAESLAALNRHHWPGNVRELENLVHRAMLLAPDAVVTVPRQWLADAGTAARPEAVPEYFDLSLMDAKARMIEQFERAYLSRVLAEARGNVSAAARRAGKERRAVGKLMRKHRLDRRAFAVAG